MNKSKRKVNKVIQRKLSNLEMNKTNREKLRSQFAKNYEVIKAKRNA